MSSLSKLGDSAEVKTCVWVGERNALGSKVRKREAFSQIEKETELKNSK